jgi:lipoprotein-anchoring transpeptidase ErfK/SrfK
MRIFLKLVWLFCCMLFLLGLPLHLSAVETPADSLPVPRITQFYVYPDYYIIVSKFAHTLTLYHDTQGVKFYRCAVGLYKADKREKDDYRTPEGNFYVVSVEESSTWEHDFKYDGKGPIKGAYGPWFYRLYTGADSTNSGRAWKGIAIHGTHLPKSIGQDVSGGCIRLNNNDILDLKKYIRRGTPVRIEA